MLDFPFDFDRGSWLRISSLRRDFRLRFCIYAGTVRILVTLRDGLTIFFIKRCAEILVDRVRML